MPPFDQFGAMLTTDGSGVPPIRIPSGTPNGPLVLKTTPGRLCRLINPNNAAQASVLKFYDDPAGGANNLRYTWVAQSGDILNPQILCVYGISVIVSGGATTADLLVEIV
jgi:hypothetical protein